MMTTTTQEGEAVTIDRLVIPILERERIAHNDSRSEQFANFVADWCAEAHEAMATLSDPDTGSLTFAVYDGTVAISRIVALRDELRLDCYGLGLKLAMMLDTASREHVTRMISNERDWARAERDSAGALAARAVKAEAEAVEAEHAVTMAYDSGSEAEATASTARRIADRAMSDAAEAVSELVGNVATRAESVDLPPEERRQALDTLATRCEDAVRPIFARLGS